MMSDTHGSAVRFPWDIPVPNRDRADRPKRRIRGSERCVQCHFPWSIHPERYDAGEDRVIPFCSEFPVEPLTSIEDCIVP